MEDKTNIAEEGVQQKEEVCKQRRGINYDKIYLDKYNEILCKGVNDNNSIDFLKTHFHVLNIKKTIKKCTRSCSKTLKRYRKVGISSGCSSLTSALSLDHEA